MSKIENLKFKVQKERLKIWIIGCGAIGSEIAAACLGRLKDKVCLAAAFDIDAAKAKAAAGSASVSKLEDLMARSDLVIEAASAAVSAGILEECIKRGKSCMMMSVGGLLGNEGLLKRAEENDIKVYIPSGALCGVDGLKAASAGNIDSVVLTTRKPPQALAGAPYLNGKKIDLASIKGETVIFEGTASEAVKGFPQNVNVSAVLSVAGIGAKNTKVRIVTSPEYKTNTHEVEIKGDFGHITTRTANLPSRSNPKTSAMAVFSAIATLDGIASSVRVGT